MNRARLKELLDRAGVSKRFYSLDGPAQDSESYSLVSDGITWQVLYKERDRFELIEGSLSEEKACDLIYKLLDEALKLGPQQAAIVTAQRRA